MEMVMVVAGMKIKPGSGIGNGDPPSCSRGGGVGGRGSVGAGDGHD